VAKKRKVENETDQQAKERKLLETVANAANRSEKTSWNRKMDNMVKLLSKIQPIEQKILDIIKNEKLPIQDEIQVLRNTMLHECVHPYEYLVIEGENQVRCKFCNKLLSVPNDSTEKV